MQSARAEHGAPTRRRGRDPEILEAAIQIFCERGYAAATIQDVADRVGMLKGSLYYYFESKEHLLFRILDDAHEQVEALIADIVALESPPIERLRTFLERHVSWYLGSVEHARVTFHEWKNLTGELLETQRERRRGYDRFVRDLIQDCQESGDVSRDLHVTYAANYLLGAINAVPDWYRRDGRDAPEVIATAYAEMTIAMLTGTRPSAEVRRAARRSARAQPTR